MLIAGTTVAANTYVVVQLTGTSGGLGTYTVSVLGLWQPSSL
jgi:hypothetical protein